jgi:hypothetical protein
MEQKRILSVKEWIAKIERGETLSCVRLEEIPLWECPQMDEDGSFQAPLRFHECEINSVPWVCIFFNKPVEFQNCRIHNMNLHAAYFHQGLIMENCEITGHFQFDSGGHNEPEFPIIFRNCVFYEFADFFDAWFTGPVVVTGCRFRKGTNLGSDLNAFQEPPIFQDNEGIALSKK